MLDEDDGDLDGGDGEAEPRDAFEEGPAGREAQRDEAARESAETAGFDPRALLHAEDRGPDRERDHEVPREHLFRPGSAIVDVNAIASQPGW